MRLLARILFFLVLAFPSFGQTVGGAGWCKTSANPNTITSLRVVNQKNMCSNVWDTLARKMYYYDYALTVGSRWVEFVPLGPPIGAETKVEAGTGIGVSGNGTVATPYIISNTGDLSATNELQYVDTLLYSADTLRVSLSLDGRPQKKVYIPQSPGGIYGTSDTTTGNHIATIAADRTLTFRAQDDDAGGIVPFRVTSTGNEPDIMGLYADGDSLIFGKFDTEMRQVSSTGLSIVAANTLALQGDSVQVQTLPTAPSTEKTYVVQGADAYLRTREGVPLSHLTQSGATTGQVPKWDGSAWVPDDDTGDTDAGNDLTVSDTVRTVSAASTHSKYPTAAAVYNAIAAGGGGGPDSTFALAPGGGYAGKRVTSNVMRTGKVSIGTADTTAKFNIKPSAPDNVNGFAPVLEKIVVPERSAFAHPTWANSSKVWVQQIDPNAMRPKVDTSFKFGVWEDMINIDSLTNSEVNRPGDLIRDVGFNLSGASSRLARWGWSTEQYYFDGVRDGQNKMSWEHHLQVRDTLGRNTRPFLLRGLHDGTYYDGGMILDVFHISKPHTNRYALNINTTTGAWYTDAPFSFKMQKDTFTSLPLFSKLYSGSYRNLLNMHTNGRTDIGDVFGTRVTDSLSMYASAGAAQAFKITGLGPSNIKWEGKIAQESNLDEMYTLTRVGNTNRMSFSTSVGNEYGIGINGNSSIYFRGTVPATRMTFLSDGNISVNGFSSQTQFAIFQPSLDRNGGIRLNPTTSGNVADIFVNASNELVIHRTNEAFRLANSGQLQLPEYTSSAAFPLTPVATAVFGSDGKIGTAAYSPLAGTGAVSRVAYWSGTNNITSSANFLFDGTKVSVNTGTAISSYLALNPNTNASSTALNGGLTLWDNGTNNLYGLDMGYGVAFGPRLFTAASADINFAKVVSGSAPTAQSDFANMMTIKGATGNVGIGTASPATPLETVGAIRSTGTGTSSTIELRNTTGGTGQTWGLASWDDGSLAIGHSGIGTAILVDGTTEKVTLDGNLQLDALSSANSTGLIGYTSGNIAAAVKLGSGLSFSNDTLRATGGGGGSSDSTWVKSDGTFGSDTLDNVRRTGKISLNTTSTEAMLNLRPKNPVGSVLTTVQKISAPPRSAFTDGIFANNSNFTALELDINPMKPAHFPSWNYGIWKEKYSIDSTTNLAVSQPGNAIRQWGFNLDNLEPKLARWYWNTEQLFYPGSGGSSAWEHYLEVYDTLDRHERIMQMFGLHNGNTYEVDFAADDWHIRKPHTTNFALRIRPAVGLWHTDYPYSFRINNATRTGPLIERLHSGAYRNVLDWTANGRLDVGDSSGVSVQNRLQIVRVNATQPEIISPEGYVVFDSTRVVVASTEPNNRYVTLTRPGTSHAWGLNFSADNFFFEGDNTRVPFAMARIAPTNTLTANTTGRIGIGLSSAYSTLDIQQHTNGLDGSLRLVPVTGDYAGLFVNSDNELSFNRGGANRMFLTNAGQLRLATYTSTSSYPITAAGVLGFNSSGEIGTVAYPSSPVSGTGAAGQIAVFDGTSSIAGYTSFTRSGSNIIVGPPGGDHVEIKPGSSGIEFFDAGNVAGNLYADGSVLKTDIGMGISGNSTITGTLDVSGSITTSAHFRAPGISSGNAGIGTTPSGTFNAFAPNGTSPYLTFSEAGVANRGAFGFPAGSGDFVWSVGNQVLSSGTERMRLTSGGNLGVGVTPSEKLHVSGNARVTGAYYDSSNDPGTSGQILSSTVTGTDWVAASTLGDNWGSQTVTTTGTTLSGVGTAGSPLKVATGGIGPTELEATAVTPGSYLAANVTVDADGRITAASSGSIAYQTLRDDGVDKVQRFNVNFVSTPSVNAALTDDGGNNETEVRMSVATDGITATEIAAGAVGASELSSLGTAGTYGSATQVPVFTTDADGRVSAVTNTSITGTLSGLTATRVPFASSATALTDDANLTWENTNKRLSIGNTGGSPAASLHIAEGSVASWEPLRAVGTVSGNMITTLSNAQNSGGASNNLVDLSVGGASAGDAAYRWLINGVDTWSMGIDNSDADKWKLKKATTPSTGSNVGITMTADATPLIGINNDAPLHPLHVIGRATATVLQGISGTPTHTFGSGAGTGPSLGSISGCTNGINIQFTLGSTPTVGGNIVSITLPTAFSNTSFVTYSCGNDRTATENAAGKFVVSATSATALTIKHNAEAPALTAGDVLFFRLVIFGR